ncbi:MAG: ABC transporter ATP-binding protein [Candidatus Omnitrophota bacterium]|nr:ABC transporter ATP-binding protein [Candidatus Omnitrophota bacterium]
MIRVENLHKSYKNGSKEVLAVNGVSLETKKAKTTAIVGPSGAGKSTLLHILGGLDKPTSGKVLLDDVDIYGLSDNERARARNAQIGFVFQFYHLLPEFTALENVMMPGLIRGTGNGVSLNFARDRRGGTRLRDKALNVLKSVGLKDRASHRPGELSGGESQRVAIARALINEPGILLCDEPTGNLDSKNSESIYELLFNLKSNRSMTLVIVTHDESISKKSDHVICIRDGKVV